MRLINGTKVFIQTIIDNYSRYILAWRVTDAYGGASTKELINKALNIANVTQGKSIPNVFVDSGTENINSDVDSLINSGLISRTIAQIDIEFSNSMIEAFFRSLKHKWLFRIHLASKIDVEKEVDKYCHQHNNIIPHHALGGATPLGGFFWLLDRKVFFRYHSCFCHCQGQSIEIQSKSPLWTMSYLVCRHYGNSYIDNFNIMVRECFYLKCLDKDYKSFETVVFNQRISVI